MTRAHVAQQSNLLVDEVGNGKDACPGLRRHAYALQDPLHHLAILLVMVLCSVSTMAGTRHSRCPRLAQSNRLLLFRWVCIRAGRSGIDD